MIRGQQRCHRNPGAACWLFLSALFFGLLAIKLLLHSILFESGLGGSAFEWQSLQQALTTRARTCVYDRAGAGYGWSGPSSYPRTARRLAAEANRMLVAMDISGPLILVRHSFGGFVMRLLALQRAEDMLALVLIDRSHERQLERLETAARR